MFCDGCKTDNVRHIKIKFWTHPETKEVLKQESCERCSNIPNSPPYFRDAAGNKVVVTQPMKYSYATDSPISSASQYSEVLKKNNLAQKGQ